MFLPNSNIKKIIITLIAGIYSLTLFAQNPMNNYKKEWDEISKLENDGLTKSCLEKAENLYEKIKKDKKNTVRTAQMIKALLYVNNFKAKLEEDGLVKAIYRFQLEAENAELQVQPILYSMLAEMYDQYLSHHLHKFSGRTQVLNHDLTDIRTWDVQKITDKCFELYLKSLQFEETKTIALKDYDAIVYYAQNSEGIHPTLYDFLMHRALEFFLSEKYYLSKPAFKFYIDKAEYMADANTFIDLKIEAKDSLSMHFQTLLLFQKLLSFHIKDKDPAAFIHSELKRLNFVRSNMILPEKEQLYYRELEKLTQKFTNNQAVAEVWHALAAFHANKGDTYKPSPLQVNRWELKKALEICEMTISKHPNSFGASHCAALISDIKSKSMELKTEKVNSIQKPFLATLQYKNLKEIHFKVIAVSETQYEKLNNLYYEEKTKYINSLSAVYQWSEKLPDEGDYQLHRLELKIPALPSGMYLLAASDKKDFSYDKNAQIYTNFHVSDLAYIYRQYKGQHEYYVTDRNSGQALEGVKAVFYEQHYNNLLKRYEWRKSFEEKTDKNGWLKSKITGKDSYSNSYRVKWSHKNDELSTFDNFYNYKYEVDHRIEYQTHFFLDRAIYRPGQTVYFKGIVIKTDSENPKKPEIAADYSTTVIFYDVNNQELAKIELTTNEYGSFQGSFTAPAGGLLGQMKLYDQNNRSSINFRVEEYKRPKFEVEFKPLIGSFKVDEKVIVSGLAKAYAGSSIDGAKVSYRVLRQTTFPFWRWWAWGWWNPFNQEKQEIKFGETETDENGEFSIEFDAIPDKSVPLDRQPVFNYTVYADIIDISGETHSKQIDVRVGYVALDISLQINENLEKNELKSLKLLTQNLNGQHENAKGSIRIEKLTIPVQVFKSRFWDKADYFLLSKENFNKDFADYPYANEDQVAQWPVEKEMLLKEFDSEKSDKIEMDMKDWAEGKYKVTLSSKDKFDNEIEIIYYFSLFDKKSNAVPMNNAIFLAERNFFNLEPDTSIILDFGAFDKDAWFLLEIEHDGQIVDKRWLQPNGRTQIPIKIEEKHRGNFSFHLSSVQKGRFYNEGGMFYVPWSNKELSFEYMSFREKLYPGQPEEWRIKISGPKKEKIAAEYLGAMYDASLDAFAANFWNFDLFPSSYRSLNLNAANNFCSANGILQDRNWNNFESGRRRLLPILNWHSFSFYEYEYYLNTRKVYKKSGNPRMKMSDAVMAMPAMEMENDEFSLSEKREEITDKPTNPGIAAVEKEESEAVDKENENFDDVKVRTNLNETVFFFPQLMTDENGDIILKFTMNEALTRWKFMSLAHTKDLKTANDAVFVQTQKDLMVMPNAPRFFRQGDKISFTTKISNLTEQNISGRAVLQLFDALSMQSVDVEFTNKNAETSFTVDGMRSTALAWELQIPSDWSNAITFRIIAKAGDFSDGEEGSLPVLSNSMLVTETMPLPIRGGQTKTFNFGRMADISQSSTMRQHKYTLEFTQNPAWYAIQSLPYLMEYPYECTEQIFSRYYANSLATEVANSHPKVKRVFDQWKNVDTEALKSNLHKNQELKYALLEETPWVLDAQSEEQQKKNIGLLFDLNRMSMELERASKKMQDRQLANGGFSWFPGGRDSWYITQYIVEGFGHLNELGVKDIKKDEKVYRMISKAVLYCDDELGRMYNELLKTAKRSDLGEKKYLELDHLNSMVIHYLYARSFFLDIPVNDNAAKKAIEYYEGQAIQYWRNKSMYMKGLLSLGLHRKAKDNATPAKIVADLRENSLYNEEMGMYWKYPSGYFWYEAPIETHALMIEVFDEVANDSTSVDNLKVWLLKNKQTSNWKTTKATAAAVYALLRRGDNWLMDDQEIEIHLGGEKLDQSKIKKEAGTGYFKSSWNGSEIKSEWAEVKVSNPNKVVAWGAVYWQYFEQLDKITHFQETPLKIDKKLFKQINTDRGPKLEPIEGPNVKLEPGDLVKVRIELRVDRDMEYVHMKDMRASGFEPISVLSQYKYQGGLGYYESTRDASTNFFFDYLSKGTYVFEYGLRVNHKGDFSNGITTIQCMYAPEFTSHSEGVRVIIE
jgi:hypothetical protein